MSAINTLVTPSSIVALNDIGVDFLYLQVNNDPSQVNIYILAWTPCTLRNM